MYRSKKLLGVGIGLGVLLVGLVVFRPFFRADEINTKKVRYRFRIVPPNSLEGRIAEKEKQVAHSKSILEEVALAELYFQRAKRDGLTSYFDKADAAAEHALSILPRLASATAIRAKVMQTRHQFRESLDSIAKSPELGASPGGAVLRITAHLGLGQIDEAHREADALVERLPSTSTYTLMAQVLETHGFLDEARFYFDRALIVEDGGDPEGGAWTRTLMGRFYLRRGQHRSAQKLIEEALRIDPGSIFALGVLGDLERQRGDLASADGHYAEAFSRSKDPLFALRRADVKLQQNDRDSAQALLREAESMLRQEIERGAYGHRAQLAQVLLTKGGVTEIREAVTLIEDESRVRRNYETLQVFSRALRFAGQWRRAQGIAREILRSGVQSADAYHEASLIERQFKNYALADFYAGRVKALNPAFREGFEPPLPLMIN